MTPPERFMYRATCPCGEQGEMPAWTVETFNRMAERVDEIDVVAAGDGDDLYASICRGCKQTFVNDWSEVEAAVTHRGHPGPWGF